MAKNIRTAMALLRDNDCFRSGNALVVKNSNRVAHSDVQSLIDRGYAAMSPGSNRVFITEKGGFVNKKNKFCYRTRQIALKFIQTHDRLVMREGYLVSPNGKRLSAYSAQYLFDEGLLVVMSPDVYVPLTKQIEVSGDIYPAVKAFVEMLERARS